MKKRIDFTIDSLVVRMGLGVGFGKQADGKR